MAFMGVLAMGIIFALICITIITIIAVIYHFLTAIGVYRIAKRRGIKYAFLAWIPIAQTYLYAKFIGTNVKIGNATIPQFPWIYTGILVLAGSVSNYIQSLSPFSLITLLGQILNYIEGQTPVVNFANLPGTIIGLLLLIVVQAVRIFTMYRVFRLFRGNAVLLTVLGAVIPFAEPVILLVLGGRPFVEGPQQVPAA